MRGIDLDASGPVWAYRPGSDQGRARRAQDRLARARPRRPDRAAGQEVLRPWLRQDPGEYLFQPKEARAAFDAERRANRKSPMTPQPGQRGSRRRTRRSSPASATRVSSYDGAIYRACRAGVPAAAPLARREDETKKEWQARLSDEQKAELKAWEKRTAGRRTSSGTPRPPSCGARPASTPPASCWGTARRRSPRSTPSWTRRRRPRSWGGWGRMNDEGTAGARRVTSSVGSAFSWSRKACSSDTSDLHNVRGQRDEADPSSFRKEADHESAARESNSVIIRSISRSAASAPSPGRRAGPAAPAARGR